MKTIFKKITIILTLLIISISLISCSTKDEKYDIVASSYIPYDIATNIVKDKLNVGLIVPFGAEVHHFEQTTKDMKNIKSSKLFIYTGDLLDSWVGNIKDDKNAFALDSIFQANDINPNDYSDLVHFWTSPTLYIKMIELTLNKIILIDSINSDYYRTNANNYIKEIIEIKNDLTDALYDLNYKHIIYFAGHNSMSNFANEFNLDILSLSASYQPDKELHHSELKALISEIKENQIHHLFHEELADTKAANTIKLELEKENYFLELLELHSYHNVTKDDGRNEVTYAELFERNKNAIKQTLSL